MEFLIRIFSVVIIIGVSYSINRMEFQEEDMTPKEIELQWDLEREALENEAEIVWFEIKKFIIKLKEGKIKIKLN